METALSVKSVEPGHTGQAVSPRVQEVHQPGVWKCPTMLAHDLAAQRHASQTRPRGHMARGRHALEWRTWRRSHPRLVRGLHAG